MDLFRRLIHAVNRDDSWKNILREKIYNFIFKSSKIDATEIQYLQEGNFRTRVVEQTSVTSGTIVEFYDSMNKFRHTFSPRDRIVLQDVILNTRTNTVWTQSKFKKKIHLISESTEWPNQNILIKHDIPDLNNLKEVDCGKVGLSNEGFFHWIQEDFPRVSEQTSSRNFLQFEKMNKLNLEVFNYFEAGYELVPEWIRVNELEFESRGKDVGYLHPFQLERLHKISNQVNKIDSISPSKIYVSRLNQRRSPKNEKDLIDFLLKNGFYIFEANKLSFIDQIKLFANPRIVIGIHGAGLIHALWSNSTCLVELMPKIRINRCFEWQSLLNNNEYFRIDFDNNVLDLDNTKSFLIKNDFL